MKSLKQICEDNITHSVYEVSILADVDDQINAYDNSIADRIEKWIKENYEFTGLKISNNPNKDGLYEVTARSVEVKNKNIISLTNGLFEWKKVNDFYCSLCTSLKSLEGAPKEVEGYFNCAGCNSLKSLKGAPQKVEGWFDCYGCKNLSSLEGAPLTVKNSFYCSKCTSLESLEGASKNIGGDFYCSDCKIKFTKDDVRKVSDVKGEINI